MGTPKKVTKLFLLAHKGLSKNKYKVFLFGGIFFSWALIGMSLVPFFVNGSAKSSVLGAATKHIEDKEQTTLISPVAEISIIPSLTPTTTPTTTPSPVPTAVPTKSLAPTSAPPPISPNPSQYTAEKINDVTWRVSNLTNDDRMASASEIVDALNNYRTSNGRGRLSVDGNLSAYAQERVNLFAANGSLDSHAGFRSYMDNGGFDKAGFNSLGENSAYASGSMNAEKIVKGLFGADSSHDGNQLDNWTHVGVAVNGNAINVNFGKNKK